MVRRRLLPVTVAALALAATATADARAQLPPPTLTAAGVDSHRRPFVRWEPAWPLVNILVSTRPVRGADGTPALRYWVKTGAYDSIADGPERLWRSDDALVPGNYYASISGDAPFQHTPFTPFKRLTVAARHGEWTGPTSQKRYIRLTHPGPRLLRGLSFSVYGANDGCHASFVLHRRIRLAGDGRFSARVPQAWSIDRQTPADVRVRGRLRGRVARGTLRVDRMFEGCKTGLVRWTARPR